MPGARCKHIGQIWERKTAPNDQQRWYLLAVQGGEHVALINIANGKRWSASVKVADRYAITNKEWDLLEGNTFKWRSETLIPEEEICSD
jgi:hypothetical protein